MIAVNRLQPHTNGAHSPAVPVQAPAPAPKPAETPVATQVLSAHPLIETALLRIVANHPNLLKVNEAHAIEAGGLVLTLSIGYPIDMPPVPESDCERDVLDVVTELQAELGRRALASEIIDRLNRTGRMWGRSTTVNALATLTHKGLLLNPRDKRGYGLPVAPKDGAK